MNGWDRGGWKVMKETERRENYFTLLGISPTSFSDAEILSAIQEKGAEWIRKAYGQDAEARQYVEGLADLIEVMSDPGKRAAESEEILKLRQSVQNELNFTLSLLASTSMVLNAPALNMLVKRFGAYGYTAEDLREEFRRTVGKNESAAPAPKAEPVASAPKVESVPPARMERSDGLFFRPKPAEPASGERFDGLVFRTRPAAPAPEEKTASAVPEKGQKEESAPLEEDDTGVSFGFVLKRNTQVNKTAADREAAEAAAREAADREAAEAAAREAAEREAAEAAAREAAEREAAEAAAREAADREAAAPKIRRTGEKAFGIALGNAFSRVSYVDESGIPFLLKNEEGKAATPAYVRMEGPSAVVVGDMAKDGSCQYPEQTITTYLRDMVREDVVYRYQDAAYSPEDILTFVLKKIAGDANESLEMTGMNESGETVRDVVIAMDLSGIGPDRYVSEINTIEAAAERAGLNVLTVLRNDFAALIGAGLAEPGQETRVAVFDLGGTSLSVDLVKINEDGSLRWSGGNVDPALGSKDWEKMVINYLAEQFALETGASPDSLTEPENYQQLQLQAERAMKMLSSKLKVPVAVNCNGDHVRIVITREQFEMMTSALLDQAVSELRDVLSDAKQSGKEVSKILLVGGGSRMPAVRERIQNEFGIEVMADEPDEVITKGAAIFGKHAEDYMKRIFS